MSITAKVLRIGVAFVTAAHVVRYLIVVLFTTSCTAARRRRGPGWRNDIVVIPFRRET
jgi:uncharacterized membrane protein AbrB (regulator of aidB expression)